MSAINFEPNVEQRETGGDWAVVIFDGEFVPYQWVDRRSLLHPGGCVTVEILLPKVGVVRSRIY